MIILPNSLYSLLQIIDLFENPHANHKCPKCLSFLRGGEINVCHKGWFMCGEGGGGGLKLIFVTPWLAFFAVGESSCTEKPFC